MSIQNVCSNNNNNNKAASQLHQPEMDALKASLGDLPHSMVVDFLKSLIAFDVPKEAIVEEYTQGGVSGIIEARMCLDGRCRCEYTGTSYIYDPNCDVSMVACLQELANNAVEGEKTRALNRILAVGNDCDASTTPHDDPDDSDYVLIDII